MPSNLPRPNNLTNSPETDVLLKAPLNDTNHDLVFLYQK